MPNTQFNNKKIPITKNSNYNHGTVPPQSNKKTTITKNSDFNHGALPNTHSNKKTTGKHTSCVLKTFLLNNLKTVFTGMFVL
jgi:hypothetical protein